MMRILSVLLVVIFAAACDQTPNSSASRDQVVPKDKKGDRSEAQTLTVLGLHGEVIPGATVLIGSAVGAPFSGNLLTTDELGSAQIPTEWLSSAPVTVQAPGYISVTYQEQMPRPNTFTLRPQQTQEQSFRVAGDLTGFGRLARDGRIDFGVVVPALTRQDLFQLDVTRFLSTEMDTISVIGQEIEIPGNLVLPTQRERYGLIPINLSKDNYSIYFSEGGLQTATTLHGQFDVSDVVKKVTSKAPYYELIKDIKVLGGSMVRLEITDPNTTTNLAASELRFETTLSIQAPTVRRDEIILAVSIAENDGTILPTGITALESAARGQIPSTEKWGTKSLVTVRKRKADFEQEPPTPRNPDLLFSLSATVLPVVRPELNPENLELVHLPELLGPTQLQLTPPPQLSGVEATATYAALSLIEEAPQGLATVEKKTVLWESYTGGWATEVALPESAAGLIEKGRAYRWEVSFIGQPTGQSANLGPQILDQATHVSLSAKSF